MKTDTVVVVGGGTSGWMAATTLIRLFPKKKITLVESPDIKTIGVGESTLGQLNNWLSMVSIDPKDFMKACNAVFKFGIRFNNFYKKDSGYYDYPFGVAEYVDNNKELLWYLKKAKNPNLKMNDFVDSFYPIMAIINSNKVHDNSNKMLGKLDFRKHVAYHFDATKFGLWLRDNICLPEGLHHIKSVITDVKTNVEGIVSLGLANGETLKADLYVDCTGFRSMLLGKALGEKFISFEKMLPNNCAWATHVDYVDKEKQIIPYAFCDAIDNGWVWTTPLWESIGTGYVYSDKFISDEDALCEFKEHLISKGHNIDNCEFSRVPFRVGIFENLFVKNVVAVGLSAGFIEPLESNGLLTVHEYLSFLNKVLKRGEINQFDRDSFNYACRNLYQNWAEFIALHYALSVRDDTPYWKSNIDRIYDTDLKKLLAVQHHGFRDALNEKMYVEKFPANSGIGCISAGYNWTPVDENTIKYDHSFVYDHSDYSIPIYEMEERVKEWNNSVENSPSLYEYLKRVIYHD